MSHPDLHQRVMELERENAKLRKAYDQIRPAAHAYEEAVNRLGLAYSSVSENRNQIAGEVYNRRKEFIAALEGRSVS